MDKKVLLVAINAKYIHSNLAVYSMKACAGQHSDKVHISEYTINNSVSDILDDIYMQKPEMIGFSCYIWNIEYVKKLMVEIHKLLPQCEIWLGGPEVSYNTDYYLDKFSFITGIMVGEGEDTFREVVDKHFSESCGCGVKNYSGIAGVCTYDRREPGIRKSVDMSQIPFVYKQLSEFNNRIIYYESSRGCPFSCSYCLSSIDKKLRFRDIELVEQEIGFFLEHKVPQVKFVDRTFNCDRERSTRIWKFIQSHDNGITNFHFEISADLITDEQINILNAMRPGLVQLEIGVQTTNAETISAIRRRMDIDKLKTVVARLNDTGNIHLHLDLIAGLPFEDMESFKKSFNDVYEMKPDELQLGFLKVLNGSYMYEDAKKYGIVYKDFPPYEVLYTQWMSYEDILRLKNVEEVLEIYFGSGQFKQSVRYILKFYDSPYEFYDQLGAYYAARSRTGEKHSRLDRYTILLEFVGQNESLCGKRGFRMDMLKQLMTYDVYVRENIKTRPQFATDITGYREKIKELARAYNIERTQHIEPFTVGCMRFIDGNAENVGERDDEDVCYVVFDYSHRSPVDYNVKIYIKYTLNK